VARTDTEEVTGSIPVPPTRSEAIWTGLGSKLDAGNVRRQFKDIAEAAGLGRDWTPQELRHTLVSLLSAAGTPVDEIARLAGHSSTGTTEVIYRRELRPVMTRGAEAIDGILA
jgi:integrase